MTENETNNPEYDPTVGRGYLLLNMAGAVVNMGDTNDAVSSLLHRYMDCIVQEQEHSTQDFTKVVH